MAIDKEQDKTWYVIADGTRARVVKFEETTLVRVIDQNQGGRKVRKLIPALNREFIGLNLKSREILADRSGQRTPGNPGPMADPHENAKTGFALELADILDKALNQHQFDHLVLVAPPDMLGKLRHALPDEVRHHIAVEQDKDLTRLSEEDLADRLGTMTSHKRD